MSGCRIIAYRESNWLDLIADNGMWHLICKAYKAPYVMFDPDAEDTPDIDPGETVVIFDEQGETELEEFDHPADCVYVFGRSHINNLLAKIPHQHSVVIGHGSSGTMFGISAVAIMLEDRRRKQKRNDDQNR